jgi:hypothetical protein
LRRRAPLFLAAGALALAAPAASNAAGPPLVGSAWSFQVQASSARLGAQVNPNGHPTTYHFDYITEAAFQKNEAEGHEGFSGAFKVPSVTDANINSGTTQVTVAQLIGGLSSDTVYRYRVVAKNSASPGGTYTLGEPHTVATLPNGGAAFLPDSRGWEQVSPIDKNGGQVDPPGTIAGGGVLQAAADGQSVTYGSSASFGQGAQGAAPASQYIAQRTETGWATENITAPIFAGTYDTRTEGTPYQLFSADLGRSLLFNGEHCRGEASGCAVANPPLPGTGAPGGYQNYYLRESFPASFAALLGASDVGTLALKPANFDIRFAGASSDLRHVVLSSCAALTPGASEEPLGEGCDPAKANLYEWSSGTALGLISSSLGAKLAAEAGAVSENGERVYWEDSEGKLHLHQSSGNELIGPGTFQTASANGAVAFYLDTSGHLQSYDAVTHTSTNLTPSGGVAGVLGASADGKYVYYATAAGVFLRHESTTAQVSSGAVNSSDYPPTTGTSRVSFDGTHLLFVSTVSLTEYDNLDLNVGSPDSEVYLYDSSGAGSLTCVSCNPTHERPIGPSTIPGAIANGTAADATDSYKPRVLSADGGRVFFESRDTLAGTDTNAPARDVYQWEAQGEGSCARPAGCVSLISGGRGGGDSTFIDASANGNDAFFLTEDSLVSSDPGSIDLYDARVGGGFPSPKEQTACEGDACQVLPRPEVDPTIDTLQPGHGNPPPKYHCLNCMKKHHHKKKHHKRHHHRGQGR